MMRRQVLVLVGLVERHAHLSVTAPMHAAIPGESDAANCRQPGTQHDGRCKYLAPDRGRRRAMFVIEMMMLLMFLGACGGIVYYLVQMLK